MARQNWSRTVSIFVGLLVVLLLGMACAKSDKTAAPAPAAPAPAAPAPAAPAKPAAPASPAPSPAVPAAPSTVPAAIATAAPVDGQPLLPGGPAFYLSKVSKLQGYQYLQDYSIKKLSLWTQAKYGGEHIGVSIADPKRYADVLGILNLSRPTYAGMLMYTDFGRCSIAGRTDFSKCDGKYSAEDSIVLLPGMFERWQQLSTTEYVFTLRKGILWPKDPLMKRTDREVTAEDIAWFLTLTKEKGIVKVNLALVKDIVAADRYTVKVTMISPQSDFLTNMAHTSMGVVPKECYEDPDKHCMVDRIITPGPFLMGEFTSRQKIVFTKNPEFYLKGLPYLDRITLFEVPDTVAQQAGFTTGKFDNYSTNSFSQMKSTTSRIPGSQVHASGGIGGVSTMMKIRMEGPLADVRVRRALAMAVDYPELWQLGVEGFSMFPTMIPRDYYGPGFFLTPEQAGTSYQRNLEQAKKLLAEAGYPNGFTTQHNFYSNFGTYQDYALGLQSMWKAIGVNLELKSVDFVSYQSSHYAGTWQGLINTGACWIASCWGTADDAFSQFITGGAQNFAKISDPQIDYLYQRSRGEVDPAKRRALLWEFDQYEASQVYFLRIGVATAWIMMQPWEMNGASHQTMWFTGFNGPTWLGMHDTSKYPGARK